MHKTHWQTEYDYTDLNITVSLFVLMIMVQRFRHDEVHGAGIHVVSNILKWGD